MDRTRTLGYFYGLLTALCWATSPILIRKGLLGLPSSLWGMSVGLLSATSIYLLWFFGRDFMLGEKLGFWRTLNKAPRAALMFQALAGVAAGLGSIGRTFAIELAPVVVALPLSQTTSLFTLIFSIILIGRKLEKVTLKLTLGAMLVVAGSVLVVIGQNR